MKKIERLLKFVSGGKILKLLQGNSILKELDELKMAKFALELALKLTDPTLKEQMISEAQTLMDSKQLAYDNAVANLGIGSSSNLPISDSTNAAAGIFGVNPIAQKSKTVEVKDADGNVIGSKLKTTGMSAEGQVALGAVANIGSQAIQVADSAVMGDKHFSAQSLAIDTAVHGASSALMKSGNPYAMAAGVALEGLNFITKAGGKNVQGYDVNIKNAGYGNLGHLESEAGRVWDSWSGATARKLAKRNENARMALAAADISEDQAFEQEARTNSVTNVLQLNQIALSGGIDASLLAG